ncbi:hypothetical protein GCM10023196_091360 [Actinoallomurus vinaceus]|uniref:Secreted protein n=1 Tax=Actinoallomurus vinaceus TaxID=1080074 RepID=A0ABP8UQP0_9ACTN
METVSFATAAFAGESVAVLSAAVSSRPPTTVALRLDIGFRSVVVLMIFGRLGAGRASCKITRESARRVFLRALGGSEVRQEKSWPRTAPPGNSVLCRLA